MRDFPLFIINKTNKQKKSCIVYSIRLYSYLFISLSFFDMIIYYSTI